MHCQRIQESFLDYQSGSLAEADSVTVHLHLKSCLTCQREWAGLQQTLLKLDRLPAHEPSARLRTHFYAWLQEEQQAMSAPSPFALARGRIDAIFASWLPARPIFQAAAGLALLLCGLFAGAHFLSDRTSQAPLPATGDAQLLAEVADLRKRVDSMSELVVYTLQQPDSGNLRLQGVLSSRNSDDTNDRTLAKLLNTVAFDSSTNVRLSALEALFPHADREAVRTGVLAALPRETSPIIQLAMIDFVAATRDRAATPTLQEISRSVTLDPTVRDAAQRALVQF